MHIIEWSQFLEKGLPLDTGISAMTIGVFDGVHRGHQALIKRIVHHGERAVPVVITFRENHKKGGSAEGELLSFRHKTAVFEELGAALCVAADLTESLRRTPGAEFIRLLRERGGMGFLAIGSNFRCGYRLDIDAAGIQKVNACEGIPTNIVEAVTEGPLPVSSSRIRAAVSEGKLNEAAAMLGRPHCIDLGETQPVQDGHELVYKRSVISCVLPPPGTYTITLRNTKSGLKKQSELQIEKDILRISTHTAEDWDSILFYSAIAVPAPDAAQ